MSGRHLLLLGILASLGLLSVRDAQRQVELGYKIASLEKSTREVQGQIDLCKIQNRALQSPHSISTKVAELQLKVAPPELSNPPAIKSPNPNLEIRNPKQIQNSKSK